MDKQPASTAVLRAQIHTYGIANDVLHKDDNKILFIKLTILWVTTFKFWKCSMKCIHRLPFFCCQLERNSKRRVKMTKKMLFIKLILWVTTFWKCSMKCIHRLPFFCCQLEPHLILLSVNLPKLIALHHQNKKY